MTLPSPTIVPIVSEDRETFFAFKKHRDKFLILLAAGVFDFQHGQIDINMHNGQIQQIYLNKLAYKRERE